MKIKINSLVKSGIWGGGNQFLLALKQEFIRLGFYTDNSDEADIIIFNSYQDIKALLNNFLKFKRRNKIIYRLGPVFFLHRNWCWIFIDMITVLCANCFVDLVIFQSKWSLKWARRLGYFRHNYRIILNGVDSKIFYPQEIVKDKEVIQLINTSWSKNLNKGFDHLLYLDKNLDFKKYHLLFVGNTPYGFNHIKYISPLDSLNLADKLRESNIYFSPVKDDACSNSILEAMACGLPVVALDSGANAELIGGGGVLYSQESEIVEKINLVNKFYSVYKSQLPARFIQDVAQEYLIAIKDVCAKI